jgi:hypothetical protein
MFLIKTKRIKDFSVDEYSEVDYVINKHSELYADVDLEAVTGLKGANELKSEVYPIGNQWVTIFKEIGYWRKSNQIHRWFVENVQSGVDDCGTYEVTLPQLLNLLDTVNKVLDDHSLAEDLLPTQSGFFFGGTSYSEWYFDDLRETQKILAKVVSETNFEEEIVFYHSSW